MIPMQERPMAKTLTFGAVHMSVAFGVGYAMTGSASVGGALALVEPLVNTVAYFFHEKVWQRFARKAEPGEGAGPEHAAAGEHDRALAGA
jgi:uncharacterized membrane protein